MPVRRLFVTFLLICLLTSSAGSVHAAQALYEDDSFARARQLLVKMTPEERVGQLFLVTFKGTTVTPESEIYSLIANYHIGGVVFLAENDNFVESPYTLNATAKLIAALQTAAWESTQTPSAAGASPTPTAPASRQYIPLFVGIAHTTTESPAAQIFSGLTPLPPPMALGATWDPLLAERTGNALGSELSSLGFNLLFGPSLDVLENPDAALANGLGTDTFGGDPFWVSQMGKAYLRGLHTGGQNRLLVVARNFPGRGSTDRPLGTEAPTVRKSLEQLKQIELAPFFAVTAGPVGTADVTDGLLVSHIRYQGFQGNIRATTRPVSLDAQALSLIMNLPEFATWRAEGGLLISEDLGNQTVRRFYDPGGTSFQARIAARDAFLAGNDLIYLGNIQSSDSPDTYTTVINVLTYFIQKYREDAAFAERVDESVIRILAAKYRLFDEFDLANTFPTTGSNLTGSANETITFETARRAATLVSPDLTDLDLVLPEPPGLYDNIVFITDTSAVSQCSSCPAVSLLGVEEMQNAILRLYGPHASALVTSSRLNSYSLENVSAILSGGKGDSTLETTLRHASWIVINTLDFSHNPEGAMILRRFLSERQDLLRNKYVILFAFGAPYFLDATQISNLTAYYCLYNSAPPFVDVAARLLFRELTPLGDLPVSVPGVEYDLFSALTPDPNQVITLSLNLPSAAGATDAATPLASPTLLFRVGDTITIQTGILLDHNGHPVPDGTEVQFLLTQSGAGGIIQQVEAATTGGVASATFNIDRAGLLEIRAISEQASTSVILQLDVSGDTFSVTVVAPTPSLEPSPVGQNEETTPESSVSESQNRPLPGFSGWLLAITLLSGIGFVAYFAVQRQLSYRWGVRMGLCTLLGGLTTYSYLALRLPGAADYLAQARWGGIAIVTLIGALIGLGGGYLWFLFSSREK